MKLEEANARRARLLALADAYEPGNWALCDGVDHIYRDVPSCCQTLRDDLRAAIRGDLAYPAAIQPTDAGGEETLEQRLKDAAARVAAMSPEEREAMFQRQKEGYVRAEMSWGDEGTRMAPTPPAADPLATAINRYAGSGRELFEMIYARLRELEGR